MGRFSAITAVALCGVLGSACGEPLVVLGDAPGVMRIVLGAGDSSGTRVDSLALRTRLTLPSAVVYDASSSTLYAADQGSLRQVSGTTRQVARIFAVSTRGRATLLLDGGGCAPGPCIEQVTAVLLAADGSLIIADAIGHRVLRYVPRGGITVLAGTGTPGSAPDGSSAATSPIHTPSGITLAGDGSILFSERGANRVRAIDAGGLLRTVAGTGSTQRSGDGSAAVAAGVVQPAGLLRAGSDLFIAEYGGNSVRRVDGSGTILTVAGIGVAGFSGDNGPATAAQLNRPFGLAVTANGRTLFVSEFGNERVRAIDLVTGVITTFAGTGDRRFSGNRRAAGETALASPAGMAVTESGFIYIADPGHHVVWRTSMGFN